MSPSQDRPSLRALLGGVYVFVGFGMESALAGLGAPPWSFAPIWLMFVALRHQGASGLAYAAAGAYVFDVVSGENRGLMFGAATWAYAGLVLVWSRRGEPTPTSVILGAGLLVLGIGAIRAGLARFAGLPSGGLDGWLSVAPLSMGLAWPLFRGMDLLDARFRSRDEMGFRVVEGP